MEYILIFVFLIGGILTILCFFHDNDDDKSLTEGNISCCYDNRESKIQQKLDELSKLPEYVEGIKGKYLFIDTETTGLPKSRKASINDFDNWPYVIEIAWLLTDEEGKQAGGGHYIINQSVIIPEEAIDIHHISNEKMRSEGVDPKIVYTDFIECLNECEYIIAHNIKFDLPIIQCDLMRNGFKESVYDKQVFCTMERGQSFCKVYDNIGKIKFPKLTELFGELYFNNSSIGLEGVHNALSDTLMVYRCFMKMKEKNPLLLDDSISTHFALANYNMERLSGNILKKDLSKADSESIFYNKKVVISGEFPIGRYELALILKIQMGADIDSTVGKYTQFLLAGDSYGPIKMAKAEEIGATILNKKQTMEAIKKYM